MSEIERAKTRRPLIVAIVSMLSGNLLSVLLSVFALSAVEKDRELSRRLTTAAIICLVVGWILLLAIALPVVLTGEPVTAT